MRSSVVLLGAGASVPAALPTALALTEKALAAAAKTRAMALPLNYVVSSLQLQDSRLGGSAVSVPDIERLVSAVKMLSERDQLEASPFVVEWDGFIDQLERRAKSAVAARQSLERALLELAHVPRSADPKHRGNVRRDEQAASHKVALAVQRMAQEVSTGEKHDIFGELHTWLLGHVVEELTLPDPQVTDYLGPLARWAASSNGGLVATLNYDLTVEAAAQRADVVCRRGVNGWPETGELDPLAGGALELLKLHGSLDWKISGDSLDANPKLGQPFQNSQLPGIIYGRRDKLRPVGPFLQLLERFRSSLAQVQNLVIFGYSFHDEHIDIMIERWMRATPRSRVLVVEHPGFQLPPSSSETNLETPKHSPTLLQFWANYGPARFEYAQLAAGGSWEWLPDTSPVRFAITKVGTASALQRIEAAGMTAFLDGEFSQATSAKEP